MKKSNRYTKKNKKRVKKGAYYNSSITQPPKRSLKLRFWGGNDEEDSLDNLDLSQISQNPEDQTNLDMSQDLDISQDLSVSNPSDNSMHLSELDVSSDFNRTDSADESNYISGFDNSDDFEYGNLFDNQLDHDDTIDNLSTNTTSDSNTTGGKKSRKTRRTKDKHIGKVKMVYLPNNSRARYRWIVKKRHDGRYIGRAPKVGVLIKNLHKKLENDYNSEHLLPKEIKFIGEKNKRKSKKSKRKSKKSRK
jgi:hypothetical protein